MDIKFGPRSKTYDFKKEKESNKKYYIELPNFTWNIASISYDSSRAEGLTTNRTFHNQISNIFGEQVEQFWEDINPVPYNVSITLEVNVEEMDDACQVIEQICCRFAPENYLQVQEFWFFKDLRRSLKLKLESKSHEITQVMGEQEKREIKVTFSFTLEMFFYKPIQNANIIKIIEARILDGNTTSTDAEIIDKNKFLDIKAVASFVPHSDEFIQTYNSNNNVISGELPYIDQSAPNSVTTFDYIVSQKEKE